MVALVTDNFSVNAALGYVDNEYKKYSQAVLDAAEIVAANSGSEVALVGADLPRLAPWTANLGVTYDMDLGTAELLTFRGNYGYRDAAPFNDANTQIFESERMADVSVQWTSDASPWTVSAFGKNLNDEIQWGSLNGLIETSGGATKGRLFGVEANYTY